jgi:hypothetical protein
MSAAAICSWFVADDWFVAGVGADIAGAVMLSWSFVVKRPRDLAEEILLVTRTWGRLEQGLAAFGHSVARQKAEAHVGLAFLAGGFVLQLFGYLMGDGGTLETTRQYVAAGVIVAAVWLAAFVTWKLYVPWRTAAEFGTAKTVADRTIAAARAAAAEEQHGQRPDH